MCHIVIFYFIGKNLQKKDTITNTVLDRHHAGVKVRVISDDDQAEVFYFFRERGYRVEGGGLFVLQVSNFKKIIIII